MGTHNGILTCVAGEQLDKFYTVALSDTQDDANFATVVATNGGESVGFGIVLDKAEEGERVAVMPIIPGGVTPVRVKLNVREAWAGVSLSYSSSDPGRLSTAATDFPVAYIFRASTESTLDSIVYAIFVRCGSGVIE